jgi:pimeloyl-ACP methyl ester carboxylesterase
LGASAVIVFSHANSFPASTYRLMFEALRAHGFTVSAIEKYGHDPRYPVSNNWPHLVQQLCAFTEAEAERVGQPVWLVGHSLGGYLSLMAALRLPQIVKGVVLVDSPLLGGWKSSALGLIKRTPLLQKYSPGAISRNRRNRWDSVEQAFAHFRNKKAFANWDEAVLRDYVTHGTEARDGRRVLAFDRAVETAIYDGLPHTLERQLKLHPLRCPVHFIGGTDSEELRRVGLALTQRVTRGRISMLEGSHLFPMEKPLQTADAIAAVLRGMDAS